MKTLTHARNYLAVQYRRAMIENDRRRALDIFAAYQLLGKILERAQ